MLERWGTRFALMSVDNHLNPPPLGIAADFELEQAGTWWTMVSQPFAFGAKWLLSGFLPSQPVTGVRYTYSGLQWANSLGGWLQSFEHPCPWPTAYAAAAPGPR